MEGVGGRGVRVGVGGRGRREGVREEQGGRRERGREPWTAWRRAARLREEGQGEHGVWGPMV